MKEISEQRENYQGLLIFELRLIMQLLCQFDFW